MEGGVGTKRLPALPVWEQNACQHYSSGAGNRFALTPPSIYGGDRGAYMMATAVTCLHVC